MSRILVVDDERAILDAIGYTLKGEGYDVETLEDGESALEAVSHGGYDLVILDLLLPGLSGIEVCRRVRAESNMPILILTAKDAEVDYVVGLDAGADDYVTKPFSMAVLASRVRAIIRRRSLDQAAVGELRQVGRLTLDLGRHEVGLDGRPVVVTPSEFRLLVLLSTEPERAYTRREIMQQLWQSDYTGDGRACDAHVSNLRRKLESDPRRPERLVSVRGVGYKLCAL